MNKTLDEIMEDLLPARREKIEQRSQELIREHVCRAAAAISHQEATITELAKDKAFAQAYLSAAFEELDSPDASSVVPLALPDVAEAYGGLAIVAQKANVSIEDLDRALAPCGDPTINVVIAILHLVGMRLFVVPA